MKSGYIIYLVTIWWDTAHIHSSPDPSLFCGFQSESSLQDYSQSWSNKANLVQSLHALQVFVILFLSKGTVDCESHLKPPDTPGGSEERG